MDITIRASLRVERGMTDHPLKWAFVQGSELGFNGLELCLTGGSYQFVTSSAWTQEWKDGVKEMCEQYNMGIQSMSSDWAWTYGSFFPELKDWDRALRHIEGDAKLAAELGAHTILVHFGRAQGSKEEQMAVLGDIAKVGEENGVAFGFEANIWSNTGQGSYQDLLDAAGELDSPGFGIYLHNGYPRAGLPLHEEVIAAGDRIVKAMHSSDLTSDRVEIDWEKAIPVLRENFADGAYVFEVGWDRVAASKKIVDDAIAKYW